MLKSLEVKNYRNLKDLQIDSFGRINLITGKNNTGKSTLLEAIALYSCRCDINFIYQLLDERGENYKPSENNLNLLDANLKTFLSLFNGRNLVFSPDNEIMLNGIENTKQEYLFPVTSSVSIRFVRYMDYADELSESSNPPEGVVNKRRIISEESYLLQNTGFDIGLQIRNNGFSQIVPLEEEKPLRFKYYKATPSIVTFQLIRTKIISRDTNGKLWDAITLTAKEGFVIDALKIIEPDIERLAYIEEYYKGDRNAVIKLKHDVNVLPITSMGDGINRILTIILALVNCDNGYLLIDEFENGLHYTVQEQLWKIVFKLSKSLNIQVFATTHSEDCIRAFESVLNNQEDTSEGKLIRLDNINGIIKQTEFNASELKIAFYNDIETR